MRQSLLKASLAVFVLGTAAPRADAQWWSANGASCAVGDPAIQANRYAIGAGSVKHRAGMSGLITLYCAVNPGIGGLVFGNVGFPPDIDWTALPACTTTYRMRQTYTDADGTDGAAGVKSQLIRMVKGNGDLYSVAGASLDSSANPAGTTTSTSQTVDFDHAFDFRNFYYYVRVDLDRPAGSTASAIFYGVALECR